MVSRHGRKLFFMLVNEIQLSMVSWPKCPTIKNHFVTEWITTRWAGSIASPVIGENITLISELSDDNKTLIKSMWVDAFGVNHTEFFDTWLNQRDGIAYAYVRQEKKQEKKNEKKQEKEVDETDGKKNEKVDEKASKYGNVLGFGVIRGAPNAYKIGPLLALSDDVAESLVLALSSYKDAKKQLYVDVPDPNQNASTVMKKLGLGSSWSCARMYTKGKLKEMRLDLAYSVTTFEVGP